MECPGVPPRNGTWADGGVGSAEGDLQSPSAQTAKRSTLGAPTLTRSTGISEVRLNYFGLDWNLLLFTFLLGVFARPKPNTLAVPEY